MWVKSVLKNRKRYFWPDNLIETIIAVFIKKQKKTVLEVFNQKEDLVDFLKYFLCIDIGLVDMPVQM